MPTVSNVARFLPEAAARHPDICALKVPRAKRLPDGSIDYLSLSFAELDARTNSAASILAKAGIGRGTRTVLMVKPGLELILVTFALFKLGAVPIVIDPGMGLKSFLACVQRSKPEALVGIPKAIWLARFCRKSFASCKARVCIDASFVAETQANPAQPLITETQADELAAILFTSGSTGPAKGVCYEHGMFEAQVEAIRAQYNIEPGEVDLPMLPVFALFNPALGMTTVVPEMNPSRPATVDPAKIVQAIQQCEVTTSFGSPVLWGKINDYCKAQGITLPTIKRVLMAGAPAPTKLLREFRSVIPNGEIHSPYGATENLPVSSISAREVINDTAAQTDQGAGTCVGKPLPGVSVKIIQLNESPIATLTDCNEMPVGEIGEIIVNGSSTTKAYDQLPEATAKAKISDPETGKTWHRMGDLGYLDAKGRIWFCGRMAERVETADGPLYTDCVEPIFNRDSRIYRSALIGIGNRPNQRPAIIIERAASGANPPISSEELKEIAQNHPNTAMIEEFLFEKQFPVDVRHNAKINRLALARKHSKP